MRLLAIIEFWLLVFSLSFLAIFIAVCYEQKKENKKLNLDLQKTKSELAYAKRLMELKETAYANAKEKNKKLDEGDITNRISVAGDVLCKSSAKSD